MIVIDGNALGYAAQYAKPMISDGVQVQAIYQFLRSLKNIRERFDRDGNIVVLWDGRANFRFDLHPEYKGNRNKDEKAKAHKEEWQRQSDSVQSILPSLNVTQMLHYEFEADDLAGYLTRKITQPIRLITGDQDWQQLVSPTVSWHDMRTNMKKDCDFSNFNTVTGFDTASRFLVAKAMIGDTSDNIQGVEGIGPKSAGEIMSLYGSVKSLKAHHKECGGFDKDDLPASMSKFKKKLNNFCEGQHDERLARNLKLMNLGSPANDEAMSKGLNVTRAAPEQSKFEASCRDLGFLSIVKHINQWSVFY